MFPVSATAIPRATAVVDGAGLDDTMDAAVAPGVAVVPDAGTRPVPIADAAGPTGDDAAPAQHRHALRRDVRGAMRDAAKLGASLIGTWAIGLAVRMYIPRHLGPAAFGGFQFADAFTTTALMFASLGVDTYTRKEVASRREHASDFFGGTLLMRMALSAVVLVVGVQALRAAGKPDDVLRLVVILGLAQVLLNLNTMYASMLQGVGRVSGLSVWNVASKVGWGLGIALAFLGGWGVTGVAVAMLASEAVKTGALAVLARRHVGLQFRVDMAASTAVVRASLPFFAANVAQMVYSKVDVSIMSFLASDTEVGWYGAASTIAGMSMLLSPLIGWVLLPLSSRAAARSQEELMLVSRRSMELILAVAVPTSLLLYVGAGPIVALAFGPAYAPAAAALRLLAPTFVLTYAAMVSATVLIRLERPWALSVVTMSGMVLSPALNLVFIRYGMRSYGQGGAGIGAAAALVLTELYAAGLLAWLVGRHGVDGRLGRVVARTAAVCAVVLVVDWLCAGLGVWRLALDAVLYAVGVVVSGAVNVRELIALARGMMASRRAPAGAAA